jgi:hypothetical protein
MRQAKLQVLQGLRSLPPHMPAPPVKRLPPGPMPDDAWTVQPVYAVRTVGADLRGQPVLAHLDHGTSVARR